MKKIIYLLSGLLALFLSMILVVLIILFIDPTIMVNERNIGWALDKSKVLEMRTWKKFEMSHEWKTWNHRRLTGDIDEFCFRMKRNGNDINSCFGDISWDFDLMFTMKDGFSTKTWKPFTVWSQKMDIALGDQPEQKEKSGPIDIFRWWSVVWSDLVPDMDFRFDSIQLTQKKKTSSYSFDLKKRARDLIARSMGYILTADPEKFELKGPDAIEIPEKNESIGPFYFRKLSLRGKVTKKSIPLNLTGYLEEAAVRIKAELMLPLPENLSGADFRKSFLSTVGGEVRIPDFRKAFSLRAPAAFRELPAPLNVMTGIINLKFDFVPAEGENVTLHSLTTIDLKSAKEALDLEIEAGADIPVMSFRPETLLIGLNFHEVKIELPRLSKKSPPPQFMPDKRFKNGPYRPPEVAKEKPTDVNIHLEALNKKSLHLATNLLDEPLRLNFDLLIGNGSVKKGHVTALPLKTEIFRRPVHLKHLKVTFNAPLEPIIEATINFPLPEYKVTLDLEGPVSKPRYAFRSDPPLPQNDIYAVLLFGRPLADLDPDDKTAAQKTNQLLSNGILSLSVLYFLAGSPVEYVGFDPDSKNATAQFGLTRKTSLRVGGGQEGMNAGGVRHSLGKGWYIDSTVKKGQTPSTEESKNYGVLLERVMTY
ncbi:MAG: translocation/assembly module TamB domain-containing protein [Bdellovibrionota bacterium]